MTVHCATCDSCACRLGRPDGMPDDCPTRGPFPDFETLYADPGTRTLAYHAARVEAEGYCRWTRLRELVELSQRMGFQRLGLAHCPETDREAAIAERYLRDQGLEAVRAPSPGDCDPEGQADFFAQADTQFNVIVGMCVGHDTLFIRRSRAPVTSLVVRDLRLRHNPVAALYTRKSYLREPLSAAPSGPPPSRLTEWTDDLIRSVARDVRDAGRARATPPCRLEEIIDFAWRAGVRHLGLAYCVGFRDEAEALHGVLVTHGFVVSSVCCKSGSVPKDRIGIDDAQKIRPGTPEMICNPLAQAELLEGDAAQLVLLMGQCVGHDSATMAKLRVPVVTFVAKDRVLAHNSVAALYAVEDAAGRLGT